jgi:hypothetical protein
MFETGADTSTGSSSKVFHLLSKGIEARGRETASGFVVLKDSTAVGDDKIVPSMIAHLSSVKDLRDELIRQGVLIRSDQGFVLAQDYVFGSPSTAAAVLLGRSANGRVEWKMKDGRTLKEVQEAEAAL